MDQSALLTCNSYISDNTRDKNHPKTSQCTILPENSTEAVSQPSNLSSGKRKAARGTNDGISGIKEKQLKTSGDEDNKVMPTKQHAPSLCSKRPFMCKICGKSFWTPSKLKSHSFTHKSERPFKCVKTVTKALNFQIN